MHRQTGCFQMTHTLAYLNGALLVFMASTLGNIAVGAQPDSGAAKTPTTIASLEALYQAAAQSNQAISMKPGVYALADYLDDERIEALKAELPGGEGRPPRWLLRFSGSDNTFDLSGVTIEIDTDLYRKLPYGYMRCLFVTGDRNHIRGLTVRHVGPNQGSNGNTFSVYGRGNTIENVELHVYGSKPYGYGDLLGKGGPNLIGLQKQSGFMVTGQDNTLRRCKVYSRAFGHCFYIQRREGFEARNIRLEDCYAEGVMRTTNDMLRETSGVLADLDFRCVYMNRDGRYMVTSGYTKSLCEDGYRAYGGVGNIVLKNCTAINTRAGFEIGGTDDAETRTVVEGASALGCERGYLIGSNVIVRNSRGDLRYGPLLYLRGGTNADVELELAGVGSESTVHALATIAGEGHRVRIYTEERERVSPTVPIMLGFGMPAHGEMASPIEPADTRAVTLVNEIARTATIVSQNAVDCDVRSVGPVVDDETTKSLRGARGAWPSTREQR